MSCLRKRIDDNRRSINICVIKRSVNFFENNGIDANATAGAYLANATKIATSTDTMS